MWVVEYSKMQGCFHVTTLEDSVARNRRMYDNDANNDYQIIALADTFEEANEIARKLKR
jgi:hypothetical protein